MELNPTAEDLRSQILAEAGIDPAKVRVSCEKLLATHIPDTSAYSFVVGQYAWALEQLKRYELALVEYRRLESVYNHANNRQLGRDEVTAITAQARMLIQLQLKPAADGLLKALCNRVDISGVTADVHAFAHASMRPYSNK